VINIAQDGDVVLTERLDTLKIGPVHAQFWVLGRFEVKNGQIIVWRDYFDFLNFHLGVLRGLIGAVVPALRPKNTHRLPR
jgi:limonene-1,2-epoxide hydrolase